MKQTSIYTAALAAALIFIPAACSDEQFDDSQQSGASGPLITVTATQGDRPQTRLGYDDPSDPNQPIAVTWATGDKFYVSKSWNEVSSGSDPITNHNTRFSPYTLESGAGNKKADFTGSLPTYNRVKNGDRLCAIYGDGKNRITGSTSNYQVCKYGGQYQQGNNKTSHLSVADFMAASTIYEAGKQPVFNFTHLGAMIKFNLTLPQKGLKVKRLKLTTTDGSTPFSDQVRVTCNMTTGVTSFSKSHAMTDSLTLDFYSTTLTDTQVLTAYMMVAPTTLTKETDPIAGKDLQLKVYCDAGNYVATLKGAEIEAGKYYTIEEELTESIECMKFTIKLTNTVDFTIPFPTSGRTPAGGMILDWGDGSPKETISEYRTYSTSTNPFKHKYPKYSTYTITITTKQLDDRKQQIPKFSFLNTETERSKVISMDTPLLNTGETDFSQSFAYAAIQSLAEGFFDKNRQATIFKTCFYGSKIVSLPVRLFDKNTQATDFTFCFQKCEQLTSLPVGLFSKNTLATDFTYCFNNCKSLKELPTNLFHASAKVFFHCFSHSGLTKLPADLFERCEYATSFRSCFYYCKSLTELPTDLFGKNTQATSFESCFSGCENLASLPIGLFEHNGKVTDYSSCFANCWQLVLNDKIFNSQGNLTVFRGRKINFEFCFANAGRDLVLAQWSQSVAPLLWLFTLGSGDWTVLNCYNDTKASNLENNPPPTDDGKTWGTPLPRPGY